MNIAGILKYCPEGTKLYSTVYGEVTFYKLNEDMIYIKVPYIISLFSDGKYDKKGECILFPSKDQRDWEEFRFPVKRGDVMMEANGKYAFIANGKFEEHNWPIYICGVNGRGTFMTNDKEESFGWTTNFYIPASEEAKKELFSKMTKAGYKWNAGTLELEKIESKFKEGDVVIDGSNNICLVLKSKDSNLIVMSAILYSNTRLSIYNDINEYRHISELTLASTANRNKFYSALIKAGYRYDKEQHLLIKQKFKPFDKVLVRNNDKQKWIPNIFLRFTNESIYKYSCIGNDAYDQCIPYEGNEYLLDTTDSPM